MWTSTRPAVAALDSADELACLRDRYNLSPGVIRLDGNGGGPLPRTTTARLREFVAHRRGGGSTRLRFDDNWRLEAQRAAEALAPLIGASAHEITVAESTSIHLFKALVAATRLRPERRILAVGRACFPTDHYIARSAADFTGTELRLVTSMAEVPSMLDAEPAVVALAHIDGLSGAVRDAAGITAEIHRHGALALWELSDSAGALEIDLHAWNADFVLGSGAKYLGGGSGAPAYSFMAQRHQSRLAEASLARACDSTALFDSAVGSAGAPSTLSMTALRAALSNLDGISGVTLEAKAKGLVALFLGRLRELGSAIEVVALEGGQPRGPQVSLRHPNAQRLANNLFARGIVADFLEPDVLRFRFAPAWVRYVDAWEACEQLHGLLASL